MTAPDASPAAALARIRARIDQLDELLVAVLGERLGLAVEAAAAKRRLGLPVYDAARESVVLARAPSTTVREVLAMVVAVCRRAGLGRDGA